jgi:predicted RNA polymerase sigma factor
MFIACHPVLPQEARVALTLRLLGGLTTAEIARAYLSSESTVAQRLVRAKRTLANAQAPFELPRGEDRKARLPVVLEAIYLIFNEGYAATAGEDWMRPTLCQEAQRLARILVGLVPNDPEVHGLAALLDLHASRMHARTDRQGKPVLLLDQNRARWDRVLIQRGLASLAMAEQCGAAVAGPYQVQAAIAACHARAVAAEQTDWKRIAQLYAQLAAVAPSPVVELNRAVAVGMAFGPQAGLDLADALAEEPALRGYHLLPSVRGEFLERLGRADEAREAFATAAALTQNERERQVLLGRAGKS